MAAHLGMPVGECMRRHTQRQYLAQLSWIEEDLSRPSRSDHYLMQVAAECRRAVAKDPKAVKSSDFSIKFVVKGDKAPDGPQNLKARSAQSKAGWLSFMSMPVEVVLAPPDPI